MTALRLAAAISLLFCCHMGLAQEKSTMREITGSFRFRNDVYTYKCQVGKNGATLETHKITNTSAADTSLRANLSSIRQTLITKLKDWGDSTNDDPLLARSTDLSNKIDALYSQLDSVKNYLDSVNRRLDTLKAHAGDSIQKVIIAFQEQVGQARIGMDKLSSGQPTLPNIDWSIVALKGALYQQLLPNTKSLALSDNDLTNLALEIFYKGEAVKDLTDNPPVTANMTLLNDHIHAYIENVPVMETLSDQQRQQLITDRDASIIEDPVTKKRDSSEYRRLNEKIMLYKFLGRGKGWGRSFSLDLPISLPILKVQVEFDKGTIKNLIATMACSKGYKEPRDIEFRNNMPISVSGKFDNDFFPRHRIYAFNPAFIHLAYGQQMKDSLPAGITIAPGYTMDHEVFFKVDDLISYSITLENDKEDYSPADNTYVLTPIQPIQTLVKQSRSQVLTVKAFTDFMGVNKEASNGLIQFEANLNANFLTRRVQRLTFFPTKYTYQGFLTQANVDAMITKIEENNKFLILGPDAVDSGKLAGGKKAFFASPIDLYRYKSNSIDFCVTVWKLNIPQVKSNFHVNGRFGVSRANVADSFALAGTTLNKTDIANERMITFTEANLSGEYEFTPDSDHGFYVGYGYTWISVMSEDIKKTQNLKGRINTFYIGGFLATGNSSKVFFRWRLNYQAGDSNQSFNQVQLGYLVDIFAAKK